MSVQGAVMEVEAGMNMENTVIVLQAYWKMFTYFWPLLLCAVVAFSISEWQLRSGKRNDNTV
jgi:hypothetical protein